MTWHTSPTGRNFDFIIFSYNFPVHSSSFSQILFEEKVTRVENSDLNFGWILFRPDSFGKELQRRIQALEMRCYRKTLRISYKDHAANEEVRAKIDAGNRTTRRPDHRKETQTAVVWPCLPFIRSGQNHLARRSKRGKKTRRTEEDEGKQHQGMDRPGVR